MRVRAVEAQTGRSGDRAERGMALVASGIRAVLLTQIGLGFVAGVGVASPSSAYITLTIAVVVVSVTLILQCLTSGSARKGWWQLPDVALAWLAYPVSALVLPEAQLNGTWIAWAPALAVNVAALSGTWMRAPLAIANGFALAAWGFVWIGLVSEDRMARVGDALTIPGYAIVVTLLASYLRALAQDADQSRDKSVAAIQAFELERYQLTVHDATSVLRLMSDTETPAAALPGLRQQGHREANRLRRYLRGRTAHNVDGAAHNVDGAEQTLGDILSTPMSGFKDLPLEPALQLGARVALPRQVWTATTRSMVTVLHNVRLHARASQVVVHAGSDGRTWEVVVSDDGVGFDQTTRALGFGLRAQVQRALKELNISVTIVSAPGRGTSVTMVGPVTGSS